jgi:signal transduction histidine kinase
MTQVREGLRPVRPVWLSVNFVVWTVVLLGALCLAVLAVLPQLVDLPEQLVDPAPAWLLALFLVLAALSEVIYVPVRHADSWEELAFVEVVMIWGVLTLPPLTVTVTCLLGFALVAAVMRRPIVKSLFNLGSYAIATTGLMVTYYALDAGADTFSVRSMAALLVAALVFAGLNLLLLSVILFAAGDVPPSEFLAEQWGLSVGMAVASVGVATMALSIVQNTPVLAPFAALPAAALWYAYRASSSHAEARERSRWLVQLGQAVASPGLPDEVIPRAAEALRRVYGADEFAVVLASGERFGADPGWQAPVVERREVVSLAPDRLPADWTAGVAVRLEEASGAGVMAIGTQRDPEWASSLLPWARSWSLPETDKPALLALTAAVGSSMRAGQTLSALTEETAKLQAVVDHATDGICVVDAFGRIVLWSPAAARITGHTVESGQPLPDVVARIVAVPSGELGQEVEFTRGDEQTLSLHVMRVDVPGAEAAGVLTIRDMTRERRAERMKSDFIATVSHELRTPITPIRGYASLLRRRWDRMSEEKRDSVLATIEERANHLTRLVDDLLIAARASTQNQLTVEVNPMELVEVVQGAAKGFPEIEGRLTIADSEPIWVSADATRVAQIIGNLVGNALKYTPEGSPIEVSYATTEDAVEVRVTDHGPGIAADEQERVFERFYRIEDPMTMRTGGSGLGLHISRELARAMGGDVRLESTPGTGSTFILRLAPGGK